MSRFAWRFGGDLFPSKDDFIKSYDRQALSYDQHREDTADGAWLRDQESRFICSQLQLPAGSKVLEAGCGTGRILLPLSEKGYDCYGIDASAQMLAVLQKKRSLLPPHQLLVGDIEEIPFPDETFDGVYTVNVLQWLPDGYEKSFSEMYRVAKRNGRIVMDFPNADSLWRRLKPLTRARKEANHSFCYAELLCFFAGIPDIDFIITGNFSYPQVFFRYPVFRVAARLLERVFPLPLKLRSKFYVVATKK